MAGLATQNTHRVWRIDSRPTSKHNVAFGNFVPGILIPLLALVSQSKPFPLPEQSAFPTTPII
jgi:hypothetical protein